jgi:hypothetical protein
MKLTDEQLIKFAHKLLYCIQNEMKEDKPFGMDDQWKEEICKVAGIDYWSNDNEENVEWSDVDEVVADTIKLIKSKL